MVRQFTLHYPEALAVDLEVNGIASSLRSVLHLYKRPKNTDPKRFIEEVLQAGTGLEPPKSQRRSLDWNEAREMMEGGMAIRSHTHSHNVLSQLNPDQQRAELAQSRSLLQEHLGANADVLAYTVGATASFSKSTQQLVEETGYRAAFSTRRRTLSTKHLLTHARERMNQLSSPGGYGPNLELHPAISVSRNASRNPCDSLATPVCVSSEKGKLVTATVANDQFFRYPVAL